MVEPGTHPDPDEPQELIHDDAAEAIPSEEVAEAVETVAEALEEGPSSPKAITKILGAIGPVASKALGGTTAVASQVGGLARAYPRASIASGLSALVLCGVFSLQSGKAPPTNKIKNPEATGTEANAEASPKGTEIKPKEESGTTPPPATEAVAEAPAPAPVDAAPAPAALEPTPEPTEVKLAGGDLAMPELPSMIDTKASEAVAPAPAPAPEPPAEPGASLLFASAKQIEEPPAPEPTPAAEPELPPALPAPAPAPGPEPTGAAEPELPPAVPAPAPEATDSEKAPAPAFPAGPEPEALTPPPAVEPEPPAPAPRAEAPSTTPKSDAPASQPSSPPAAPAEPAFPPPAEPIQPSAPPAAFPALGAIAGAAAAEAAPGPNMTTPPPEPTPPLPASQPTAEPKTDWLPLKHNGGPVKLDAEEMDSRDGIDPVTGESRDPLRDARRAANEEPIRFVPVEPRPAAAVGVAAGAAGATAAAVTSRASSRTAAASDQGKMDTVLHKVQAGENFWTISRTHYASGRYYRALGRANADQFQRMEDLYVGAVIRIPPPEDLYPAFIDPPGGRSSRNRDPAETAAAPAKAPRTAAAGTPVRRGKLEGELNLPISDPSTERTADTGERRRASSREDYDAEEPAATSRRAASPPVHKVRARETLRTIARDRLGDSRRAREILDLNRDVIDDPARLPVGQVLNLPDDAE